MPTPDRTTHDAIVTAAAELLEQEGLAGVTMQAVAQRVGVRAPSLYKRVESREALIRSVAESTLRDYADRLGAQSDPARIADVLRRFGHERPAAFQLVMTPAAGTPVAAQAYRVAASTSLLQAMEALAGPEQALEAARTLTAWATGFISMEINGGFTLGGDVEDAWAFGLERLLRPLAAD